MPNIFINDKNLGPIITVEQLPFIGGTDVNKNALYRVYEDGKPALYYYTNIDGLKSWQKAGTGGLEIVKDVASLTEIDPDKIYAVKPRDSFTVEAEDQVGKFCFISKEVEGPSGNFYIIAQDPEPEKINYKVVLGGLEWTYNSSFSDFANDLYYDHEIRDGVHWSDIIRQLRFANNFPSFKEIKENDIEGGYFYKDMETGEAKYYPVEKSLLVDPPYNSDAFVYDRNWTYFTYDLGNKTWNQIGNPVHEVGIHPYISSSYIENNIYLKGCIFKDMNDKLYTWDSVDGYHLLVKGGGGVTEVNNETDITADNTLIQYVKKTKQLKYMDADGYKTNLSFHVKSVGMLPDNAFYGTDVDDCIYYLRKNSLSIPDGIDPRFVITKPGFFKWGGGRYVDGTNYTIQVVNKAGGLEIKVIKLSGEMTTDYDIYVMGKDSVENFARCIMEDSWNPYVSESKDYIMKFGTPVHDLFSYSPSTWFNCVHVDQADADVMLINLNFYNELKDDDPSKSGQYTYGVLSKGSNESYLVKFEDRPVGYYWYKYDYVYNTPTATFDKVPVGLVSFDFNGVGNGMIPEPPQDMIPGFTMHLAPDGTWKYDNYQIADASSDTSITPDQMLDVLTKNLSKLRDDAGMNLLTIESRLPSDYYEFGSNPRWMKLYTKVYFGQWDSRAHQTIVDEKTNSEFERYSTMPNTYVSNWGQIKEGCIGYRYNSTIASPNFEEIEWYSASSYPSMSDQLQHPIKFWVKGVEYYDFEATSRTRPYPAFYSYASFLIDVEYEIYVHRNAVDGEVWAELKRHLYPRGASGKVHDRVVDIYLEGRYKITGNRPLRELIMSATWEDEWHYEQKKAATNSTKFTQDYPWFAKEGSASEKDIIKCIENIPLVSYAVNYEFNMMCYVSFRGNAAVLSNAHISFMSKGNYSYQVTVDFAGMNNPFEHVIHSFAITKINAYDGCYAVYSAENPPTINTYGGSVTFRTDKKQIASYTDPNNSLFSTYIALSCTYFIKADQASNAIDHLTWNYTYSDSNGRVHDLQITELRKSSLNNHVYLCVEDSYKENGKKYVFKKDVDLSTDYPNKTIAIVWRDVYSNATWEEEGAGQVTNLQIVRCTEAEYTALATKDPNTLYILN